MKYAVANSPYGHYFSNMIKEVCPTFQVKAKNAILLMNKEV